MHKLYSVIADIEKTHSRLGDAVAFACICAKAKMCLLIVSPAGCGKSSISDAVGLHFPDSIRLDSVTRSGLRDLQGVFNNFHGLVVIDDLGKVDTNYSRIQTVTTFAELCYSHFIAKHSFSVTIEISEFFGSAILNVQPPILAALMEADEWEVVTQDKTVRYYHLFRPAKPCSKKPEFNIDWGVDLDTVNTPDHRYKVYSKMEAIASIQWSDSRVLQHLDNLLRATAALDGRINVNNEDFSLLYHLMKPMATEKYTKEKNQFEGERYFRTNLLAVLVEFASWKDINVARIGRDYKVTESTVYRLLSDIHEWFKLDDAMSKKLIPSVELARVLKEVGAIK